MHDAVTFTFVEIDDFFWLTRSVGLPIRIQKIIIRKYCRKHARGLMHRRAGRSSFTSFTCIELFTRSPRNSVAIICLGVISI